MTRSSLDNATFGDAQPAAEVVPGCSANRPNEDTNQVTTALTPAQDGSDALSSDQASSSNNSKKCACIVCLGIGCSRLWGGDRLDDGRIRCRVEDCNYTDGYYGNKYYDNYYISKYSVLDISRHEKSHYTQDRKIDESPFCCPVKNCRFSTKRWTDLYRHTTATHCNNPAKFDCSVIECKYHGEGNGFTRKDKLTEHCRKMHRGQMVPRQVVRTLKPAPASSHAEASGSGSIGALGN